jgi:hypothetical protein
MKICLSSVHLTMIALLAFETASAQAGAPQARIVNLNVDPNEILVLHLRPGYVSSVRILEDVSSVVLGDPGSFKAEHYEAEPQLVFFKPTATKPAQTNALITTKAGREISLSLVSQGKLDHSEPVDYVLNCDRPRSFLIEPTHSSFVVAETKTIAADSLPTREPTEKPKSEEHEFRKPGLQDPRWEGKLLRVAVGPPVEKEQDMAVAFAVLNNSTRTIEVLRPQIQLDGTSREKHRKAIKAEPVAIKDYSITTRTLAPGARADGVVVFERPNFKESRERLLLAVAQAEEVDRPVLVPIAFVAPITGGAK